MYEKARCDEQRAFLFPLSLRETTAWMQEVEQRRERLSRGWGEGCSCVRRRGAWYPRACASPPRGGAMLGGGYGSQRPQQTRRSGLLAAINVCLIYVGWVERSATHHSIHETITTRIVVTDYRRYFVPGGTYFFTVTLANRSQPLLTENIAALRTAFRHVRTETPFVVDAIVVLPDHLHTIWVLPPGDSDFSTRWKKLKAAFSRQLPRVKHLSESRTRKGERGIWQRRFWEHALRDEADWQRHME